MVVINSAQLAKKFPQLPVHDVDNLVAQFRYEASMCFMLHVHEKRESHSGMN